MLKPIGKQRVAEEIVQQLRSLILRGHYATGDKLPPERKLAEELGVNRASLREAIKALEQMGLVKTRQGDGTRVLDFMQTAGVELVSHLVAGTPDGVPSVEVLEDAIVQLAATRYCWLIENGKQAGAGLAYRRSWSTNWRSREPTWASLPLPSKPTAARCARPRRRPNMNRSCRRRRRF